VAKRLVTLLIAASLVAGTAGITAAADDEFTTRGTRDNPGRWVAYFVAPVGWILDTFIAKPIGFVACAAPDLTGCTDHDRRSLGMDSVDVDVARTSDE
jgi:ABC-type enterobactin transport system permease subunit